MYTVKSQSNQEREGKRGNNDLTKKSSGHFECEK